MFQSQISQTNPKNILRLRSHPSVTPKMVELNDCHLAELTIAFITRLAESLHPHFKNLTIFIRYSFSIVFHDPVYRIFHDPVHLRSFMSILSMNCEFQISSDLIAATHQCQIPGAMIKKGLGSKEAKPEN